jgi:hypothetical protein
MKKITFVLIVLFSMFFNSGCYEKTTCCNCNNDADTDGDTDDATTEKNIENCEEEEDFSE